MLSRSHKPAHGQVLLGALLAGLVLVGCGSSGPASRQAATPSGTLSGAVASGQGSAEALSAPTQATSAAASTGAPASPEQSYAPGVPSLSQLYRGSEERAPQRGPRIAKGISIAIVSCGAAAPACAGVAHELSRAARQIGWSYRVYDGQLGLQAGWTGAVREAIASRPTAIVLDGIDCREVEQPLAEARARGLPVLGLEAVDCEGRSLFSVPMQYTSSERSGAAYAYRWGALQADYAIDAARGQARIIQLIYQAPFGERQQEGQDSELKKCAACEIVAVVRYVAPELGSEGALSKRFAFALSKHPEANVVLLGSDAAVLTSGLSKLIADGGRARSTVVVGGEGYAPALRLVEEGAADSAEAVARDGRWLAWGALDELNRYLQGAAPVAEGVGFRSIDREHGMPSPPGDYRAPVDYRAAYLAIWHPQRPTARRTAGG